MLRELFLDVETTGLSFKHDRVIDIAVVEMENGDITDRVFQRYINPERAVSAESQKIHGLADEFLQDQPLFADIADELLAFIGDSRIIAHNASFDRSFVLAELNRIGINTLDEHPFFDSLKLARQRFPGGKNSLQSLCERFKIDTSNRDLHGALVDAKLLALVYTQLRQDQPSFNLKLNLPTTETKPSVDSGFYTLASTADQLAAHQDFLTEQLKLTDEDKW